MIKNHHTQSNGRQASFLAARLNVCIETKRVDMSISSSHLPQTYSMPATQPSLPFFTYPGRHRCLLHAASVVAKPHGGLPSFSPRQLTSNFNLTLTRSPTPNHHNHHNTTMHTSQHHHQALWQALSAVDARHQVILGPSSCPFTMLHSRSPGGGYGLRLPNHSIPTLQIFSRPPSTLRAASSSSLLGTEKLVRRLYQEAGRNYHHCHHHWRLARLLLFRSISLKGECNRIAAVLPGTTRPTNSDMTFSPDLGKCLVTFQRRLRSVKLRTLAHD